MNIKKFLIGASAGALLLGGIAVAAFAVGTNGGFENGTDPGSYTTLTAPNTTDISGWSVDSGTIDYIGTYWQPGEGSRSIDLSGNEAGSISQSLPTINGHTYTVTFKMAGNPDGDPTIKTLDASVGAGPIPFTFDETGHDKTNMGWETKTFNFVASSSSTTLSFTSTTLTAYGPALDDVVVEDTTPTPTLTPTPTPVLVGPPTKESQCDHNGWKTFNNPSFTNEEKCEKYVESHKVKPGKVDGEIRMANPKQKADFELTEGISSNQGKIEYQNFEYLGGLHYKAKALCVFVDKTTKESRFMYQIPSGYPGLSGLYVVAYVKDGGAPGATHDLYGHNATADLTTANTWCTTGSGFSPNMYPITNGNIVIH